MNRNSERDPRLLQSFAEAQALEKELKRLGQSKGVSEERIRDARLRLRDVYEDILVRSLEFSEAKDVEQLLWKLHYRQIEEFRLRIRKLSQPAAGDKSAARNSQALKVLETKAREALQRVLSSLRSFLVEASGFYHELVNKLLARHGLTQQSFLPWEQLELVRASGNPPANDVNSAEELHCCRLVCHKCYVYLGDLARYKSLHGEAQAKGRQWDSAYNHYKQALAVWPSSGNPHNQMAVLATYVGDDLLAVYRYFRALSVDAPFLTARENLVVLFEKNRQRYLKLKANPSTSADPEKGAASAQLFLVGFVLLHGMLFTKTSLETFDEVLEKVVGELPSVLDSADFSSPAACGALALAVPRPLQLVATLMFSVHNVGWAPEGQPSYSSVIQRTHLYACAFQMVFRVAALLTQACVKAAEPAASPPFPALLVFLEWLACRPEILGWADSSAPLKAAREEFWAQAAFLLNSVRLNELGTMGLDSQAITAALPEDKELRGFQPLAPAHAWLDFASSAAPGPQGQVVVRILRLVAAGRAVAISCADAEVGQGLDYDVGSQTFSVHGHGGVSAADHAEAEASHARLVPEEGEEGTRDVVRDLEALLGEREPEPGLRESVAPPPAVQDSELQRVPDEWLAPQPVLGLGVEDWEPLEDAQQEELENQLVMLTEEEEEEEEMILFQPARQSAPAPPLAALGAPAQPTGFHSTELLQGGLPASWSLMGQQGQFVPDMVGSLQQHPLHSGSDVLNSRPATFLEPGWASLSRNPGLGAQMPPLPSWAQQPTGLQAVGQTLGPVARTPIAAPRSGQVVGDFQSTLPVNEAHGQAQAEYGENGHADAWLDQFSRVNIFDHQ